MTACLHISPLGLSALIADTMVSITRKGRELPRALPANASKGVDLPIFHETRLARKIVFLNESTAIAVAGEEDKIRDYLETAAPLIGHFMQDGRPMRRLGDFANQFNEDLGRRAIEVVGASMVELTDSGPKFNYMGYDRMERLDILGQSGAIGSGKDALLDQARRLDEQIRSSWPITPRIDNVHELIRGAAYAITNDRLADEIANPALADNSWGGFVEYAYFDLEEMKWRRGPKSVHMFFASSINPSGAVSTHFLPHVVAYDPGAAHGCVLSIALEEVGAPMFCWELESLLGEKGEFGVYHTSAFWEDWRPESATVTVFSPSPELQPTRATRSTNNHEMDGIRFAVGGRKVDVGLTDDLAETIMRQICAMWGKDWRS